MKFCSWIFVDENTFLQAVPVMKCKIEQDQQKSSIEQKEKNHASDEIQK
jgi:hypothetical protein